jgi:hypothetical protein
MVYPTFSKLMFCGSHRQMSASGQERRICAFVGTSAVTLNADICSRRNI